MATKSKMRRVSSDARRTSAFSGIRWFISAAVVVAVTTVIMFFVFRDRSASVTASGLVADSAATEPTASRSVECREPAALVTVSERNVELAAVALGEVTLGSFNATEKPEVFQLLSETVRDAGAIEFYICDAIRREHIQKGNSAQIDYIRRLLHFVAAKPTPDQLAKWQAQNPMPPPLHEDLGAAGFQTPDFQPDERSVGTLSLKSIKGETFRIINSGQNTFTVWAKDFPADRFFLAPELKNPLPIAPSSALTLRIIPHIDAELFSESKFELHTNITAVPAETGNFSKGVIVSVTDAPAMRQELIELARAAQKAIEQVARNDKSKARLNFISHAVASEGSDLVLIASIANAIMPLVRNDATTADIWTAFLLENFNWPGIAAIAYARARQRHPAFQGPSVYVRLLRANYLSSDLSNPDRAASLAATIEEHIGSDQTFERFSEVTAQSLLMDKQLLKSTESLARILASHRSYAALGASLEGDIAATNDNLEEACRMYHQAAYGSVTVSLAVRGAEVCPINGGSNLFVSELLRLPRLNTFSSQHRALAELVASRPDTILVSDDTQLSFVEHLERHWPDVPNTQPVNFRETERAFSCEDGSPLGPDIRIGYFHLGESSQACRSASRAVRAFSLGYEAIGLMDGTQEEFLETFRSCVSRFRCTGLGMSDSYFRKSIRKTIPEQLIELVTRDLEGRCVAVRGPDHLYDCKELAASFLTMHVALGRRPRLAILRPHDEDRDQMAYAAIDGIPPTKDAVESGRYPWTIEVKVLVRMDRASTVPALATFPYFAGSRYARMNEQAEVRWAARQAR